MTLATRALSTELTGPKSRISVHRMTSSGRLWGRHANVDSPASGSGPTAGWHTLERVWDGQQVRQYVEGLLTNTTATTATGSWTIYRWGWQFTGSEGLDEAYLPFFGAFGNARDDAMVARWSANPLGMLWPEMDSSLEPSGGAPPLRRGARWSPAGAERRSRGGAPAINSATLAITVDYEATHLSLEDRSGSACGQTSGGQRI